MAEYSSGFIGLLNERVLGRTGLHESNRASSSMSAAAPDVRSLRPQFHVEQAAREIFRRIVSIGSAHFPNLLAATAIPRQRDSRRATFASCPHRNWI